MSIRMHRVAGSVAGIVLFASCALAQRSGGSAPVGSPGGSGHPPVPSLNGQIENTPTNSANGSLYLSGNVLLDDGTPPPNSITIEKVCNGAPKAQAYTDQKGRFSFQIGQTAGVIQDASEDASGLPVSRPASFSTNVMGATPPRTPNSPDTELVNCDLRAVLSGYRSDLVSLGARRLLDDPNIGTIVLHRLADVEGSAVSVTSLQAPKDARREYEHALQYLKKDKQANAAAALQKAVELYPGYAAAWYELGRIQEKDSATQARSSYQKALAADAKFISPYVRIAELDAAAANWPGLAAITDKLLKLDAVEYPKAYLYNATAKWRLGEVDAAEASARAGIKLDAAHRYPKLELVLASVLARKKDYAAAATHLRAYLAEAPDQPESARVKKELSEMERLSGANQEAKAGTGGS